MTVAPVKQQLKQDLKFDKFQQWCIIQAKQLPKGGLSVHLPSSSLWGAFLSPTCHPFVICWCELKAVGVLKIHRDKERLKCHRAFVTSTFSIWVARVPLRSLLPPSCSLTGQQNHLRGEHGADLGEEHMTGQSKQDVCFEGGEPHHPLQISRVLVINVNTWQSGTFLALWRSHEGCVCSPFSCQRSTIPASRWF